MKISVLLILFLALNEVSAEAAIGSYSLEDSILKTEKQIVELKKEIQSKTRLYFQLKNGATAPLYAWENVSSVAQNRKKVVPLLRFEIKDLLLRLGQLEMRREEIGYELEFAKFKEENSAGGLAGSDPLKFSGAEFFCSQMPAVPIGSSLTINQGFGVQKDKDTGLEWKSSGWWVSHSQGVVRTCAAGTLVFQGIVQGRGRVVLIDHGQQNMTLYANLNQGDVSIEEQQKGTTELVSILKKTRGSKIPAGAVLGTVKDKFYFEIRKRGVPVDPVLALTSDQKIQFGL